MSDVPEVAIVAPIVPDKALLDKLLEFQSATWPFGLKRFSPFKRTRDGDKVIYRPVCWNPYDRSIHVLKITSFDTPTGRGVWERWVVDSAAKPLSDVMLVPDNLVPKEMKVPSSRLPKGMRSGLDRRNQLLYAVAHLDPPGRKKKEEYVLNDLVFVSKQACLNAMNRVCAELGKTSGFQTQLWELLHKFAFFGGHENALARLSFRQGGPKVRRVGKNRRKPGRKSRMEEFNEARGAKFTRQLPVRPCDEEKFVRALLTHYVGRRVSLKTTYDCMLEESYKKWPLHLIPSFRMFEDHANRYFIALYDMKRKREGKKISAQYTNARVGQASYLTQGVFDIADIDGFEAKIRIAVKVNGKIESIKVRVILAVSRLSGAIIGYEIEVKGEKSESFRRCIASIYLDKSKRAEKLGLSSSKGLVSGSIDGLFADNGPAASEEVLLTACDEMGLMRMLAPPGRGDLKGVVEGVNSLMIIMMAEEACGYTRKTDALAKEVRRLKSKAPPITLLDFERLLLRAIMRYNNTTNKRRLRTRAMREAGVGITPTEIHEYTQSLRRGDAAKTLSEAEVYERFVPWQSRVCRGGLVYFASLRFTSNELEDYYNQHARKAGHKKSFSVRVKRLDGIANMLLWQRDDGSTAELHIVDEDERNIGDASWVQVNHLLMDDERRAKVLEALRRKPEHAAVTRKPESGNRVSAEMHRRIGDALSNRPNAEFGGLVGETVARARNNSAALRNAERGVVQAEQRGLNPTDIAAAIVQDKTKAKRPLARASGGFYSSLKDELGIPQENSDG